MCRIFGVFGKEQIDVRGLAESSARQRNGGPDEQSLIIKNNWALGVNRLSIQDIGSGGQPYSLEQKIFAVFNGEIYNHEALRLLLRSRGNTVPNHCDGSVITYLYATFGPSFAGLLDGMFAIAIIDLREKPKLLLLCDHLGIKSLYYKIEKDRLVFSSELAGLWPLTAEPPALDYSKADMYFSMQCILGEETIYRGVRVLKPGEIKCWTDLDDTTQYQATLSDADVDGTETLEEASLVLRDLLKKEIAGMMRCDVPVCLVTSGGLDSSLVSALAAEMDGNLKAFHIAYRGSWPDDESAYAREVAARYGLDLEVISAEPDTFQDILPDMVRSLGQPNAAPHALSTYILFEKIKERGFRVAITGEGADEQFGGYMRFAKAIDKGSAYWCREYLDALSAIPDAKRQELYHPEFTVYLETNPSGYTTVKSRIGGLQPENRLQHLLDFDLFERFPYYILRRVDHLSMAHSVEVRVPFCQPAITRFAARLPEKWKIEGKCVKRILYNTAEPFLPVSILNRPKQPFTLPIQAMLAPPHSLFDFFADILLRGSVSRMNVLKKNALERLIDEQAKSPNAVNAKAIWTIGIFELWKNIHQI